MTIRNDLIDAYMTQHGCTREYAEGLLRTVEIQYNEQERIAREERAEEAREPGYPAMATSEREGEHFALTRQVTRLAAYIELIHEAVTLATAERDRAWRVIDEHDGAQMREESEERKRLQEVIDQRTTFLREVQKMARNRGKEAAGRKAHAEDLKAEISNLAHELDEAREAAHKALLLLGYDMRRSYLNPGQSNAFAVALVHVLYAANT